MVNFAIFNEKSLPFDNEINIYQYFGNFFSILSKLKKKGLNQIRMEKDFKKYLILDGISFQQFIGQTKKREFKSRLRSFVTNGIIQIESPIIQEENINAKELINKETEYFYNNQSTKGGLACCDIWDSLTVSFDSDDEWNKSFIIIQKESFKKNGDITKENVKIRHSSKPEHLNMHNVFFEEIEKEQNLNITKDNFWNRRKNLFPNKIVFCKEIETQIKALDKITFNLAIKKLKDIENGKKIITDYKCSPEGQTVEQNPKMHKERLFTIDDKKVFFENHLKGLPNDNRIYFRKKKEFIYVGYIGKHLTDKRDK